MSSDSRAYKTFAFRGLYNVSFFQLLKSKSNKQIMDIIDFLDSDILELPKMYSGLPFYVFVETCFKELLTAIPNISSSDRISTTIKKEADRIKTICDNTLAALLSHYEGHPARSYDIINNIFTENKEYLKSIISPKDISQYLTNLYRIRLGNNILFNKSNLFHIPFELRHIVNVQRYSIPGVPSLYLGGSSYICWEELNRPDFHKIHISRFKACDQIKILDFGYRPAIFASLLDTGKYDSTFEDIIIANTIFWPLICASSIRVHFQDTPFKPEYLIPQYILQWITSNSDCDGIRYFSCKIMDYPSSVQAASNFVFPVASSDLNGFCGKLISKFEMSEPLNYQLAKAANMGGAAVPFTNFQVEPANGHRIDYSNTEFHIMESMVCLLPTSKLI